MIKNVIFCIFIAWTTALWASDISPSTVNGAPSVRLSFVFSSDEKDWQAFRDHNVGIGNAAYFAGRKKAIKSVKGKPATTQNIVALFNAFHPLEYALMQAKYVADGKTKTELDETLAKNSRANCPRIIKQVRT